MTASTPKRAGRGPPTLRIHAVVSRHRASTRGLIAGPWTPLASLCYREEQRIQPRKTESLHGRALMNMTCYRRI